MTKYVTLKSFDKLHPNVKRHPDIQKAYTELNRNKCYAGFVYASTGNLSSYTVTYIPNISHPIGEYRLALMVSRMKNEFYRLSHYDNEKRAKTIIFEELVKLGEFKIEK